MRCNCKLRIWACYRKLQDDRRRPKRTVSTISADTCTRHIRAGHVYFECSADESALFRLCKYLHILRIFDSDLRIIHYRGNTANLLAKHANAANLLVRFGTLGTSLDMTR